MTPHFTVTHNGTKLTFTGPHAAGHAIEHLLNMGNGEVEIYMHNMGPDDCHVEFDYLMEVHNNEN